MAHTIQRHHFAFDTLEARDTPAGAITATVAAGVLTITGDDEANLLTIEHTGSGVHITGTDTLINGSTDGVRIEQPVNAVKVWSYGGADEVSIAAGEDFVIAGVAYFDLGDGNNKLNLVTADLLSVGSLVVKAGDGLDTVQIEGIVGSQIGTSALFQYADGGSTTTMKGLALPGAGQVTLAALEGNDTFTLDDCQTKGVVFSGGFGQGTLNIKNSAVGPVTLNGSQGPGVLSINNSSVTGNVKAVGPEGMQASFFNSTITGDVTVKGGTTDLDSHAKVFIGNVVNLTGHLTLSGYTTLIHFNEASSLTVSKDVSAYGIDTLTINGPLATFAARNLTLSSPRAITMNFNFPASTVNLAGALNATGRLVELDIGTLSTPKSVTVTGSMKSNLKVGQGAIAQHVTVTSSAGSAALNMGGFGPLLVQGNVYTSAKLSTNTAIAGTLEQNLTVNGGAKADTFGLGPSTIAKSVTLNLKDGNNIVGIGNFQAPTLPNLLGKLTINTANGNDLIGFLCNVEGSLLLNTGGGTDTVFVYGSTFSGPATLNLGAGDDHLQMQDGPFFTVPTSFSGKTIIDMAAGNDTLILGLAVGDPNNGGGDANSKVVFTPGLGSTISGGTGVNHFDDEKAQFTGLILGADISNWIDPV